MVGLGVGPFAQAGLNEAFGLAVGLWRIGPGSDVLEAEALACPAEGKGFVAGTVVGHHPFNTDTKTCIVGERRLEEADRTLFAFVRQHLCKGDARMIVDADVDVFPTRSLSPGAEVALTSAIAGDAMADPIDTAELFDVDVDHLTRLLALIAAHRLDRL